MKPQPRHFASLFAMIVCLAMAPPASAANERPILMAHYMPWYTTPAVTGQWSGHWTGFQSQHHPDQTTTNGLPDIWSHYHPSIGLYGIVTTTALIDEQ